LEPLDYEPSDPKAALRRRVLTVLLWIFLTLFVLVILVIGRLLWVFVHLAAP
jgi:hypothetical protein